MQTKFIQAKCNHCTHGYKIPTLPDMAYGEFIAISEQGTYYQYFSALNSEEWRFIEQFNGIINDQVFVLVAHDRHKMIFSGRTWTCTIRTTNWMRLSAVI